MLKKTKTEPSNIILFSKYKKNLFKTNCGNKKFFLFKDCVNLYYKNHVSKLKISTQQGLKHKSIYFYTSPLASLKMSDICAKEIDSWLIWLIWLIWLKEHNTVHNKGRKSFHRELNILHAILNWYHHYVDESFSVPIVKRHKVLCEYKAHKPKQVDYFARPEELHRWISYLKLKKKDPVYWRLAQFMVLTGVRVGEACALLWNDYDLKKQTVNITKTLAWDYATKEPYVHSTPKTTSSVRKVYLSKVLIQMLEEIKQKNPIAGSVPIFYTHKKKLLKYNMIQCHFNSAFKACQLPWRSTHICRHSYATMALMATKNLSIVQACLGHSSQKTTERYAKIMFLTNTNIAEDIALFWQKYKYTSSF